MDKPKNVSCAHIIVAGMTTSASISSRLREIRISKALSLADVEVASNRKIRAVVLGSYERGDRALSVNKAIVIADFYGLPLSYLLEPPTLASSLPAAVVIDLRRVRTLIGTPEVKEKSASLMPTIITFLGSIVAMRNDWNGEVLSLRSTDLTHLAMAVGKTPVQLRETLDLNNLLLTVK